MSTARNWYYDEFRHLGTDYDSEEEIANYDERMGRLRDIRGEVEGVLSLLQLGAESTVIEIGTGTAEFAITAAERGVKVYALDISEKMLEYSRKKAERRGVRNIEFVRAGFLSYEHGGEPVDAVVSQLALHHLNDFWKTVALKRIHALLKDGGLFYLRDVVFSFDFEQYQASLDQWVEDCRRVGGSDLAHKCEDHIRDEHSPMGWIMEGLLRSAGFIVLRADYQSGVFATYLCQKGA